MSRERRRHPPPPRRQRGAWRSPRRAVAPMPGTPCGGRSHRTYWRPAPANETGALNRQIIDPCGRRFVERADCVARVTLPVPGFEGPGAGAPEPERVGARSSSRSTRRSATSSAIVSSLAVVSARVSRSIAAWISPSSRGVQTEVQTVASTPSSNVLDSSAKPVDSFGGPSGI